MSQSVKTQHQQYLKALPRWGKVRDVLAADCKHYLRDVSLSEPDPASKRTRQREYEDGGVFYNFTRRTLAGMVGSVMRKPPEIALPAQLEYLLGNADGAGLGLIQQAQDALSELYSVGRGGLLVDAPEAAVSTMAEQNAGMLNPRVLLYTAENIINWRKTRHGSTEVLTMIVLRERYEYQNTANEFQWQQGEAYRVLEIVDGSYQQRVFRFAEDGALAGYTEAAPSVPMNSIPFFFFGAENNDASIDNPPLEPLAEINIGHFRNSADVEDSAFYQQGTLILAPGENMSGQMFKELYPQGLRMGARVGYNLGAGGSAMIVQPDPNNLSLELMREKEEQAIKAGAQLITPTTQVTAESARLQRGADSSVMATAAINLSACYEEAIKACGVFLGVPAEDAVFELNLEFFMTPMTAQDRAAWMADINSGLIPRRAYYAAMRAAGLTNWTDEEIEDGLEDGGVMTIPAEAIEE